VYFYEILLELGGQRLALKGRDGFDRPRSQKRSYTKFIDNYEINRKSINK